MSQGAEGGGAGWRQSEVTPGVQCSRAWLRSLGSSHQHCGVLEALWAGCAQADGTGEAGVALAGLGLPARLHSKEGFFSFPRQKQLLRRLSAGTRPGCQALFPRVPSIHCSSLPQVTKE